MPTLEFKGNWNITKAKLKQKWGTLTDADLHYVEGHQEKLFGRIQEATGETRETVVTAIEKFSATENTRFI